MVFVPEFFSTVFLFCIPYFLYKSYKTAKEQKKKPKPPPPIMYSGTDYFGKEYNPDNPTNPL